MIGFDFMRHRDECKLWLPFYEGIGARIHETSPHHSYGDITTATWAAGEFGSALDFNSATPDFVAIPAAVSAQLNFTSEDFTIVARIYLDSVAITQQILCKGAWDVNGYRFLVSSARIRLDTCQNLENQITYGNSVLEVSTWHLVCVTRQDAVVKLYVDGVRGESTSGSHVDPVDSAGSDCWIGHHPVHGDPFDGKIGLLGVFQGCFTDQDVCEITQYLRQTE